MSYCSLRGDAVTEAEFSAGGTDTDGAGLLDGALALLSDPQPPSKAAAPMTAGADE
jgi:hypothetical protein